MDKMQPIGVLDSGVGGLSVLLALGTTSGNVASQYPLEKVTVG